MNPTSTTNEGQTEAVPQWDTVRADPIASTEPPPAGAGDSGEPSSNFDDPDAEPHIIRGLD